MRIVILIAAFASSLGLAASASEPDASARSPSIPFELDHGHIFVSAFVNGRGPYRFGFDTGASGVGRADAALTAELSLPKVDEAANSDGVEVTTTNVVSVGRLRVGDLEREDVRLLSRDYNKGRKPGSAPMMGIIARDFFADRTVIIDYPARTIRFSKVPLHPDERGVVAYGESFTIPVCFATACFTGKLDTGSSRGLVLPKQVAQALSASPPVPIGQAARTNSVASLYQMTLREPVRIGEISAPAQTVLYAEPSTDTINIGSDFLKNYVVAIDQRHHLLRISKPGSD
jgi:hypothetical protein